MFESDLLAKARQHLVVATSLFAVIANLGTPLPAAAQKTRTPIQHVIVIIGENRTFDHIFATYQPKHGETISNLLWKGIIKPDGTPGKNFPKAHQNSACDTGAGGVCPNTGKVSTGELFQINPDDKALYDVLPSRCAGVA